MEPLVHSPRICKGFIGVFAVTVILLITFIWDFHLSYINKPGCFHSIVRNAAVKTNDTVLLSSDEPKLFRIAIDFSGSEGWISNNSSLYEDFAPHYFYSSYRSTIEAEIEGVVASNESEPIYAVYNISVPTACSDYPVSSFIRLLVKTSAFEIPLVNQLGFTYLSEPGYLFSSNGNLLWQWPPFETVVTTTIGPLSQYRGIGAFAALFYRLYFLIECVFSLFIVTTVSALVIRALLSSGVVIIYPMLRCCSRNPEHRTSIDRVINAVYPFHGVHMRRLVRQNERTSPYIIAHVLLLLFLVVVFEVMQMSDWGVVDFWMFAYFMAFEYFFFLFARTRSTIILLPKLVAALYVCWYSYCVTSPVPYEAAAGATFFFSIFLAFSVFVYNFEVPAMRDGRLDIEKPRELLMRLAVIVSERNGEIIPPLWTIFHPLNWAVPMTSSVYELSVPAVGSTTTSIDQSGLTRSSDPTADSAHGSDSRPSTRSISSSNTGAEASGSVDIIIEEEEAVPSEEESFSRRNPVQLPPSASSIPVPPVPLPPVIPRARTTQVPAAAGAGSGGDARTSRNLFAPLPVISTVVPGETIGGMIPEEDDSSHTQEAPLLQGQNH